MRITVLLLWGRALSLNSHCSTISRSISVDLLLSCKFTQTLCARDRLSPFPPLLRSISTFPPQIHSVSLATKFDINSLIYWSKHAKLSFSFSSFLFPTMRHIFFNSIKLSAVLVCRGCVVSDIFKLYTFKRHIEKNSQTEENKFIFPPPPHTLVYVFVYLF